MSFLSELPKLPQLGDITGTLPVHSGRTSREKVAILLAALEQGTAVELLKKFEVEDIRLLIECSNRLGPLNSRDVEPLVQQFTQEFAEALGISAGSEHLVHLLEAAFPKAKVSEILGQEVELQRESVWGRFTSNMDAMIVPFLLDEHEQTSAIVLSRLQPDLAAKCISLLPRELVAQIVARTLKLGKPAPEALLLLEKVIEDTFFGAKVTASGGDGPERLAPVVNRLDRDFAMQLMESLSKTSPDEFKKLSKHVFMFEDLERLDPNSRARLFDRVPGELFLPALWGMPPEFKESVLASLSARTRRMVESELKSDDGSPRKDTSMARRKIADIAIAMSKKGEIELPEAATDSVKQDLRANAA